MPKRSGTMFIEQGHGYNNKSSVPMVNITDNYGNHGVLADLKAFASNAVYVKRNIIAVVLETPKGFDYCDSPSIWHQGLKALLETQSKSITGLNSSLTAEYAENQVGNNTGDMQTEIINMTRAQSTPTHVIVEKGGKPAARIIEGWMLNLLMDPDTNFPRVVTFGDNREKLNDLLPDMVGATVLYFEPDALYKNVVEAWLCTDMKPRTGPVNEGSREAGAAGQVLEHSFDFTALQQVGPHVIALAQRELDKMNLSNMHPGNRPAIVEERSAEMADSNGAGVTEGVNAAASTFIEP